jgi:hypothetical protein
VSEKITPIRGHVVAKLMRQVADQIDRGEVTAAIVVAYKPDGCWMESNWFSRESSLLALGMAERQVHRMQKCLDEDG